MLQNSLWPWYFTVRHGFRGTNMRHFYLPTRGFKVVMFSDCCTVCRDYYAYLDALEFQIILWFLQPATLYTIWDDEIEFSLSLSSQGIHYLPGENLLHVCVSKFCYRSIQVQNWPSKTRQQNNNQKLGKIWPSTISSGRRRIFSLLNLQVNKLKILWWKPLGGAHSDW